MLSSTHWNDRIQVHHLKLESLGRVYHHAHFNIVSRAGHVYSILVIRTVVTIDDATEINSRGHHISGVGRETN